MNTPTIRYGYVETRLGQLHYAEAGTGDPIVLLHQTPRSLDEFAEVQPLLAVDRRVVAMDMYGFGMSAKFPAPQTIEQYAAGVLALVDALGIDAFDLLGHHTGAAVAIEVAAAAPGRVRSLISSAGPFADAEYRTAEPGAVDVAQHVADGSHLAVLWGQRHDLYPVGRAELLDRFIRDALAPGLDPAEGHAACRRYRMEDRIGLIGCPVLVLAPTADPASYPHQTQLADAFVAACSIELVEIPGGTIPVMEQKPVEVATAVRSFLARVRSRSAAEAR